MLLSRTAEEDIVISLKTPHARISDKISDISDMLRREVSHSSIGRDL
jgi:hypothetical protein